MPIDDLGEHADPYNSGEERGAQASFGGTGKPVATHCPIGKEWRGMPWEAVDDGFLNWIISNIDDKPDILAAAKKELEGRHVQTDEAAERRSNAALDTTGKTLSDYAREITRATSVDEIIAIRDDLPAEHEPALRLFMTKRERELIEALQMRGEIE